MHDFSLGPPVDIGTYDGPLVDGNPLHSDSCEDGVYGCRSCNIAARMLSDDQLKAIGWPTTGTCDWCKTSVPSQSLSGIHPWDEPSCYYEVCEKCTTKYYANLALEEEHDRRSDDYYDGMSDDEPEEKRQ